MSVVRVHHGGFQTFVVFGPLVLQVAWGRKPDWPFYRRGFGLKFAGPGGRHLFRVGLSR